MNGDVRKGLNELAAAARARGEDEGAFWRAAKTFVGAFQAEAGAALVLESLTAIEAGTLEAVMQPEESPTPYARMIRKEDGRIDWQLSAAEIERRIRAFTPWPSAFTMLEGKTCKIWSAGIADATIAQKYDTITASPGTILEAAGERLLVQTGEGILVVSEVQPEGKKRMRTGDFLRGRSLPVGTILT